MNKERIAVLDVIRGFALLGLVPMNILNFFAPSSAYLNPYSIDGEWWFTHASHWVTALLFDQKMMGLFSFLFGVSLFLMSSNYLATNRKAGKIHYSRSFWLIIFGILHSFFLWEGDILLIYGLMAFLIYPFRFLNPKLLIVVSITVFLIGTYMIFLMHHELAAINSAGITQINQFYWPTAEEIEDYYSIYLGTYAELNSFRTGLDETSGGLESANFEMYFMISGICRAASMMLLGIAFAKYKFWRWCIPNALLISAFIVSSSLIITGLYLNYMNNWWVKWVLGYGLFFNWFATPAMVFAYLGLLVNLYSSFQTSTIWIGLRAVGKLALTNYLVQSFIMAYIFYGYGLALYGQLNRLELWGVISLIWFGQIVFSMAWLRLFRFGPMEWIWRFLTHFKRP